MNTEELIKKYEAEIQDGKEYIKKVKSLSSRQMTLDTKNVHILKTDGKIETLQKVINDLKQWSEKHE